MIILVMKDAMSKYFNLRKEYFDKGLDFLFKMSDARLKSRHRLL